jgi:hypothetical protein
VPRQDEDLAIATIKKNASENIVISVGTFKGKLRVDLRIYSSWQAEQMGGGTKTLEYMPTKRGVSIAPEVLDEVINALEAAREQVRIRTKPMTLDTAMKQMEDKSADHDS